MEEKGKAPVFNIMLAAMFMAVGLVLPFLFGQIQQIGNKLLPMHIPVLLCGLICGWKYGLIVGFTLPLLRGMMFGMPVLFPTGIAMAFELATYGAVIGLLYSHSSRQSVAAVYRSMVPAMLVGRGVWGAAQLLLLGINGKGFTWQMFMAGAFLNAVPGIILQLILIPAVMAALNRAGLVRFVRKKAPVQNAED